MKPQLPEYLQSLVWLYQVTPGTNAAAIPWPQTTQEWNNWYEIACQNKVEPFIFLQLQRKNISVPLYLKELLEKKYREVRFVNEQRLEAGATLLRTFSKHKISVVILKGHTMSEHLYRDVGYKPMNDIDILIRRQDVARAVNAFRESGFVSAASLTEDLAQQMKYSHHLSPYFNKKLTCFFGTHWNLVSPMSQVKIDIESMWNRAEPFDFVGLSLARLSSTDAFFHLCIHLSAYKVGLRELGDLINYWKWKESEIDLVKLLLMAQESGAGVSLFRSLALMNSLVPDQQIEALINQLLPRVPARDLAETAKRTFEPLLILYTRCTQISKIEKNYALFSISESPAEKFYFWFKMWKNFLWPEAGEADKLGFNSPHAGFGDRFASRLWAPVRISRAMSSERGSWLFIWITCRHQFELVKNVFSFTYKKIRGRKILDLRTYAAEMGISLDELRKISALD